MERMVKPRRPAVVETADNITRTHTYIADSHLTTRASFTKSPRLIRHTCPVLCSLTFIAQRSTLTILPQINSRLKPSNFEL